MIKVPRNLRLDIHVHTSPGSRCSSMTTKAYLEAAALLDLSVIFVTNHGNMVDYDSLKTAAPADMVIIPGVEISSREGDFLIYSVDHDFLRTLQADQPLPPREERPLQTAVVWAHPFAGRPGALGMSQEYIAGVASSVDGIEVYNGNWPDDEASIEAARIATKYGLAELGGSDTHRREQLMRCWTEMGEEIKTGADFVEAIKNRNTTANKL